VGYVMCAVLFSVRFCTNCEFFRTTCTCSRFLVRSEPTFGLCVPAPRYPPCSSDLSVCKHSHVRVALFASTRGRFSPNVTCFPAHPRVHSHACPVRTCVPAHPRVHSHACPVHTCDTPPYSYLLVLQDYFGIPPRCKDEAIILLTLQPVFC
jgi:hypothetical protein